MEKTGIINFKDFFNDGEPNKSDFNKEDFNDFFVPENSEIEDMNEIKNPIMESISNEEEEENEEEETPKEVYEEEEKTEVVESADNYYNVYKDKSEDFSCDIQLEGANLNETEARLILESDDWTLMFSGEIDKKGRCTIPIKKLAILNEGVIGKIRLEIIAEGTVFTPWEDDFKVKLSKKVAVKIHESKSTPKRPEPKKTGVKVKIR